MKYNCEEENIHLRNKIEPKMLLRNGGGMIPMIKLEYSYIFSQSNQFKIGG